MVNKSQPWPSLSARSFQIKGFPDNLERSIVVPVHMKILNSIYFNSKAQLNFPKKMDHRQKFKDV